MTPAENNPRRPRRVVRPGTERTTVSGASADETPEGWGETAAGGAQSETNDERLRRDVPPHY